LVTNIQKRLDGFNNFTSQAKGVSWSIKGDSILVGVDGEIAIARIKDLTRDSLTVDLDIFFGKERWTFIKTKLKTNTK